MSSLKVFTYASSDPDCPPHLRAVAHCFEARRGRLLTLLPATQVAATEADARRILEAFLDAEVAKRHAAEASRKKVRAYWDAKRAGASKGSL
jgi:hypothetical protein